MNKIGKVEGDFKPLIDQLMDEFERQHPKADPSKFQISEIAFKADD